MSFNLLHIDENNMNNGYLFVSDENYMLQEGLIPRYILFGVCIQLLYVFVSSLVAFMRKCECPVV